MSHRSFVFLFFIFLISCGKTVSYSLEFKPYVIKFEKELNVSVDSPISFSDLEGGVIGVCYRYTNGKTKIQIDRNYWAESENNPNKEHIRESLIYHELGHCVLNQDHREELTTHPKYWYSFPNSVMYPYLIGDEPFYVDFREHYVNELAYPGLKLEY